MEFLTVEALTALLTLSLMEIVLGIDNIIFIAILVGRLPKEKQASTRNLGLVMALVMRIGLLFSISWVMSLKNPWFSLFEHAFSGRDLILLAGGMFLIGKSTLEIHHKVEGHADSSMKKKGVATVSWIFFQILILDLVFSLDSVITAVGMVDQIPIMVAAMVIAMIVMLISAKSIGDFVEEHPTVKILALSFLLLIGVMLVAEGMGRHIEKGYIYFAMFFALTVELLNMRYRVRGKDPKEIKSQ